MRNTWWPRTVRPTRTPARRVRLAAEPLDDRCVPALLFVAPDGVDAPGRGTSPAAPFRSIQFAVNNAASGDDIRVAKGTYTYDAASTDPLTAEFSTKAVVIVANRRVGIFGGFSTADGFTTSNPQANPTVIDGQGQARGMYVIQTTATTGLTLEGVTIRGGRATPIQARGGLDQTFAFGGGVMIDMAFNQTSKDNLNPFAFRNVTFDSNVAVGSPGGTIQNFGGAGAGGGMAVRFARVVQLDNVIFRNNQALGATGSERGGVALGGAIHTDQSGVTGTNLEFNGNKAIAGAGAGSGTAAGLEADATGGAVAVQTNSVVTFARVSAVNNQAVGGATTGATGKGGAAIGGAYFIEDSQFAMSDAVVVGNASTGGQGFNGGLGGGGALGSEESDVTLDRVKMVANTVTGGVTTAPTSGGLFGPVGGGALYMYRLTAGRGTSNVTNSLIAGNSIQFPAGATGPATNSGGGGAGVWAQGITANFTHVTVADNTLGPNLINGGAFIVVNFGSPTPGVLNLKYSIVSADPAAPAVTTFPGNTTNYDTVLFVGQTNAANHGGGTFTGSNTNFTADPLFTAPGAPNFDYSLRAGSPAIDRAVGSPVTVDIGGKTRVNVPDLGAFEFGTSGGNPILPPVTGAGATTITLPPPPPPPPPPPLPPPEVPPGGVTRVGYPQFAVGLGPTSSAAGSPGAASGPTVNLYNADGTLLNSGLAFPDPEFTGGVRTAGADFNADGVADIVVGTGPGRATLVRVLNGTDRKELFSIAPFEAAFVGGVYVAAGDLTGDGVPDLVITPDEGGGPRVRAFNGKTFAPLVDFFGIDDPNFRGGARAAVGDINGDAVGDLAVAAGFLGGPRVAAFNGKSVASGTPDRLFNDFFAFEQTLRNGVYVAVGDVNGDGFGEIVAGGGPGGGPRVTAFSGRDLLSSGGGTLTQLANFFGGDPNNRGGIRVAVKNLDNDTLADLVVGAGEAGGNRVTAYLGKNIQPTGTPPPVEDFEAFPGFTNGVFVG